MSSELPSSSQDISVPMASQQLEKSNDPPQDQNVVKQVIDSGVLFQNALNSFNVDISNLTPTDIAGETHTSGSSVISQVTLNTSRPHTVLDDQKQLNGTSSSSYDKPESSTQGVPAMLFENIARSQSSALPRQEIEGQAVIQTSVNNYSANTNSSVFPKTNIVESIRADTAHAADNDSGDFSTSDNISQITQEDVQRGFVIVMPSNSGDHTFSTASKINQTQPEPVAMFVKDGSLYAQDQAVNSTNSPEVYIQEVEYKTEPQTISSSDPSAPANPCMICGDRGSGYHYSTFSCEGCKGFFKRTVQKNLNYSCKDQGKCTINKYTRNNCQHCRFQRCLETGMKREAVREDRSPGGKHRKKQRIGDYPISPLVTEPTIDLTTIGIKEFQNQTIDALVAAKPGATPRFEGSSHESTGGRDVSLNEMMQYGYIELKYIIDWARKVPGFQSLKIEDQMALLKSSFMELNVLRLAYRSRDLVGCIRFADKLTLSVDFAEGLGWGKELVSATVEFSGRLKEIDIDETEFCVLNGIVLTYPDAAGVQDKQAVSSLQTKFIDSMRLYMSHKYPDDPRRYGKMLLRLPALRTVSAKAAERFLSLTLDGCIQLNDLVMEMIT